METIRNYLETMFMQLPNTPEVQRAKRELLTMMEDKYTELLKEGKPENEAVGIVISEFGNLDELAGDLGIGNVIHESAPVEGQLLSMEAIRDYLSMVTKRSYYIALGVLLCITCAVPIILFDSASNDSAVVFGVVLLFVMICGAVGLFIYSGFLASEWNFLTTTNCWIDFAGTQYVEEKRQSFKTTYALLITFGVILCIFSVVPAIVLDTLLGQIPFFEALSGALVLLLVGLGVFSLVFGGCKAGGYETLLRLNHTGTIGATYTTSQREAERVRYKNKMIDAIFSLYWPTVVCVYLIWSFTTFAWVISWIIWPVAALLNKLLRVMFADEEE